MLGETSAGEFKLLRIRELDNDDVDGKPDLTLQMKIHLQTSALTYELWCGVKRTLDASDEIQVNVMQKRKWPNVLEVAKCCRHLLQTC